VATDTEVVGAYGGWVMVKLDIVSYALHHVSRRFLGIGKVHPLIEKLTNPKESRQKNQKYHREHGGGYQQLNDRKAFISSCVTQMSFHHANLSIASQDLRLFKNATESTVLITGARLVGAPSR
jgi:hypothetical protein